MASGVGFGNEPFSDGPFGEANWAWHILWNVWPSIYKSTDANKGGNSLYKFMDAVGSYLNKTRWELQKFWDIIDPWKIRTIYQDNVYDFVLSGIELKDVDVATLYGNIDLNPNMNGSFDNIATGWYYVDNVGEKYQVIAIRKAYPENYSRNGIVFSNLIEIDIKTHNPSLVEWIDFLPNSQYFHPPSLIEFMANMYGTYVEPFLNEKYQRLNIGRIIQLYDTKGSYEGYSIYGKMKGYDIQAKSLYHLSEDYSQTIPNFIEAEQPFNGFVVGLGNGINFEISSDGSMGQQCKYLGYSPDYIGKVIPGSVYCTYTIIRDDGSEKQYYAVDQLGVYPNGILKPSYALSTIQSIGNINYETGLVKMKSLDQFDSSGIIFKPFKNRTQIRFKFKRKGKYLIEDINNKILMPKFDEVDADLIPTDLLCNQVIPVGHPSAGKTIEEALTFNVNVLTVVPFPIPPYDGNSYHIAIIDFVGVLQTPVKSIIDDFYIPPRVSGTWKLLDSDGKETLLERVEDDPFLPDTQGRYRIYGTIVPMTGIGTVKYICQEANNCGICRSNKVLLDINRFDVNAFTKFVDFSSKLVSNIDIVKPLHVYVSKVQGI